MNFKDILDKFGPQQEQEIPFAPPAQEEVVTEAVKVPNEPSVTQETPAQLTANDLLSQYAQPRDANYKAPRIQIPDLAKGPTKEQSDILNKLATLQSEYKTNLADAEDRKFKSDILANIGNILPTIVAGATAMNTKANVTPAKLPEMKVSNPVEGVDKRFKTEYEGLLNQYKTLKGDGLTPKDLLYANIAQAQLDNSTNRLNTNIENTDRNAGIRVGQAKLADQKNNELSDKQLESIKGFGVTDALMADIESRLDSGKFDKFIGPYSSKIEGFKEYNPLSSGMDKDFAKFQSDTTDTLSQYIKGLSGLTVSDRERESLLKSVPNVTDKPQTFRAKLEATRKRLKEYEDKEKEYISRYQGKNVEGYSVPTQQSQPTRQLTPKDQQALDWANANPTDPRAAAILKRLGM